jgi:hypothetical protein
VSPASAGDSAVLAAMQGWLSRAVIGLNLCPFAKAVQVRGQIRCAVSRATDEEALLDELAQALQFLQACDRQQCETTLLVLPTLLADFWEFNQFLKRTDRLLRQLGLEGVFQIASFHPDFEFGDAPAGDMGHFSNRAPYPTLHLLREDSIEEAMASFPDAASIYERNMATLRALGPQGWAALGVGKDASPIEPAPTGQGA